MVSIERQSGRSFLWRASKRSVIWESDASIDAFIARCVAPSFGGGQARLESRRGDDSPHLCFARAVQLAARESTSLWLASSMITRRNGFRVDQTFHKRG